MSWRELNWVGQNINLGVCQLEVVPQTQRGSATNVELATAKRHQNLPRSLIDLYGHTDLGIYAIDVAGADTRPGDAMRVLFKRSVDQEAGRHHRLFLA